MDARVARPVLGTALALGVMAGACETSPVLASRNHSYQIAGYVGDWQGDMTNVPFGSVTQLIFGAADVAHDACNLPNGVEDAGVDFPKIQSEKTMYPELKVLLAIGGPRYPGSFAPAVASHSDRQRLVAHCLRLIRKTYPGVFNGIYVDWEGPGTSAQKQAWGDLMRTFRAHMRRGAILEAAVTPRYDIDWRAARRTLSWYDLISYNYQQPGHIERTDFESPIRLGPHDPNRGTAVSVVGDVSRLVNSDGVAANKILLGIPYFGLGYSGVTRGGLGLFQRYSSPTSYGTTSPGVFAYQALMQHNVTSNLVRYGPGGYSGEYWLFGRGSQGSNVFISYDGVKSVQEKSSLIKHWHLGGAFAWTLADDTSGHASLTAALYRELQPPMY